MIKNIMLFLTSFTLTLCLIEGILQILDYPADNFSPWVSDKTTGFRIAPNINQRMIRKEYDVEIRTNDHGFRDDEIRKKNGFRILMLGDSFTLGHGVSRNFLFVDILERELQTEIINAGVSGYEIVHQLKWFREVGKSFDADLVVYALYLGNDLSRNSDWQQGDDGNLTNPKVNYPVRTRRSIKIRQLLWYAIYWTILITREKYEWMPYSDYLMMAQRQLSHESNLEYSLVERLLRELNTEITESGAEFFVFMFPYKTIVDPQARKRFQATIPNFESLYDLDKPAKELEEILKKNNIYYLNLVPAMKKYYKKQNNVPLFYYMDGHFTPEGHDFVATQLEDSLSSFIYN